MSFVKHLASILKTHCKGLLTVVVMFLYLLVWFLREFVVYV
jgi:hypothetical protein